MQRAVTLVARIFAKQIAARRLLRKSEQSEVFYREERGASEIGGIFQMKRAEMGQRIR